MFLLLILEIAVWDTTMDIEKITHIIVETKSST